MLAPEPAHDPALAVQRVVENAVELARARAELALTRARFIAIKLIDVLLATMLTVAAAQVALVLVAFSPVLYEQGGWGGVVFALVPASSLTGLGTWMALRAWREFRNTASAPGTRDQS